MREAHIEGFMVPPAYVLYVMAYRGHIVIPTSHYRSSEILAEIEEGIAYEFGGYSTYYGEGGWLSGGDVVDEAHARIVFTDDCTREAVEGALRAYGERVKETLEQDAVFTTIEEVDVELI